MKNFFRKYHMSFDPLTFANIVIGILLIANPHFFAKFVSTILGIVCLVWGIVSIIRHFKAIRYGFRSRFDLIQAIIGILLSFLLIFKGELVASILPVIIGITVITQSISKIQMTIFQKNAGADKWKLGLILNIIGLVLGLALIINPFSAFIHVLRLLGIVLLINGISRLFTDCIYAREMEKVENYRSDNAEAIDVDYTEV